jgi:hypothetical protein
VIELTRLRELDLAAASADGRASFVSAASGLVRTESAIYVVADDELHLGVFPTNGRAPGRLVRLFEGELPDPKPARKRLKPDLESLVLLPPFSAFAHGALLAVGSGSRPSRRRGAVIGIDAAGALSGAVHSVDLTPLLAPLGDEFAEVNIEGAAVAADELRLLQRGNRSDPINAVVRFALADVLAVLAGAFGVAMRPHGIERHELGAIDGVPLCFTDGAALADGSLVFSAIAEDTSDAYRDGTFIGAAIGVIGVDGQLRSIEPLARPQKIEGIHARQEGAHIELLLVSDADDADVPAALFSARIAA